MLTSKDRAALRKIANTYTPVVIIGKESVTDAVVRDAENAIAARELIKCKVLESAGCSARDAADALAEAVGADVVSVIGSKFVLYRRNEKKPVITF